MTAMVTSVSAIAISGDSERDHGRAFGAPLKHQLHGSPPLSCRCCRPSAGRASRGPPRRPRCGGDSCPWNITAMRSAISASSSRSWLITSTAAPRAARSISAWRIVAAAPASTPQVGWLTTSTPGSRRISRPTMNFCRLPPERLTASGSRLALRTSKALVVRSTVGERRRPVDEAVLHHAARRVAGEQRVLRQLHARRGAVAEPLLRHEGRAQPPPLGDRQMPDRCRRRSMIVVGIGRRSLARQRGEQFVLAVAGDAGDAEDLAALHFDARSIRAAMPCGSSGSSESAVTTSRGTVVERPDAAFTSPMSAPTIMRASDAAVSWRGSQVAYLPAAAQDGRGVAQPLHLFELVADVEDARGLRSRAARATTKSWSASCGVSTAVGSSRIEQLRILHQARTISMRWRSPTDSRHTSRFGSSGRP